MVPEPLISVKTVAVIPFCLGSLIYDVLNGFRRAHPDDRPAQNTAGFAINYREDVDFVFLSPMKVYISSISASLTSLGRGASGKALATSVTQ